MNEEVLIRQAIAAEADEAVDPGVVLAELRRARKPKRRRTMLVAVAGFAVAAAVVAVIVPLTASRDASPPATNSVVHQPAYAGQTILVLGLDDARRTDAIILAKVAADGSVRAVALPRDTAIAPKGKLNAVFTDAYRAAEAQGKDPVHEAATATAAQVQEVTGVSADHYAVIDMAGFDRLSSAVGGVEVCLTAPLDDRFTNTSFPAGKQVVSGAEALAFVRARHGDPFGDLGRMARQQSFLRGLAAKLSSADVLADPAKAAALADVVRQTVRTDSGLDLLGLARELAKRPEVVMATIPFTEVALDGMLQVDPAVSRAFTEKVFSGSVPSAAPGSPGQGTTAC